MPRPVRLALAVALLALAPGAASAAPPANDGFRDAAPFVRYQPNDGTPAELQATAELAEARPDTSVPRCLGPTSMARTVWFSVPATGGQREITIETVGRTVEAIDVAAFVRARGRGRPRRPNACAGLGVFGDDATEDRTTALRLRVPASHSLLVQVGRRGAAGSADDERALVTLHAAALPALRAPRGDRAGSATPRLGRSRSTIPLSGATTTPEDPAVPSCPSLGGVWRRVRPEGGGRHTFTAVGAEVGALSVFAGRLPDARRLLGCVDREGPGPLVLPVRLRGREDLWVRLGTDRPALGASAVMTFRRTMRGDAESGGACLASPNPQVTGRPARGRRVARLNRMRAFELSLDVARGPLCAARMELLGPDGTAFARGDVPALRGRDQLVLLPRLRSLTPGLYQLRIESAGLGGVRRVLPSTVQFTLR